MVPVLESTTASSTSTSWITQAVPLSSSPIQISMANRRSSLKRRWTKKGAQVEVKVVEEQRAEEQEEVDIDERVDHETDSGGPPKKYYVDNGLVEIVAHLVYELDGNGKQLRVVKFTDYTAEKVRSTCPSAAILRSKWSKAEERAEIIQALEDRGISFDELVAAAKQLDADPFDLLCYVAFNAPRRERAEMLRRAKEAFFGKYAPEAREVLTEMLEKYVEYGAAQFQIPEILQSTAHFGAAGRCPRQPHFLGERRRCGLSCSRCRLCFTLHNLI